MKYTTITLVIELHDAIDQSVTTDNALYLTA